MVCHSCGNRWNRNRGFLVSWPALNQEALVQIGCTFHPPIFLEGISVTERQQHSNEKMIRLEKSDAVFESQELSLAVPMAMHLL